MSARFLVTGKKEIATMEKFKRLRKEFFSSVEVLAKKYGAKPRCIVSHIDGNLLGIEFVGNPGPEWVQDRINSGYWRPRKKKSPKAIEMTAEFDQLKCPNGKWLNEQILGNEFSLGSEEHWMSFMGCEKIGKKWIVNSDHVVELCKLKGFLELKESEYLLMKSMDEAKKESVKKKACSRGKKHG